MVSRTASRLIMVLMEVLCYEINEIYEISLSMRVFPVFRGLPSTK